MQGSTERAAQVYQDILKRFPGDYSVVERYIQILYKQSKIDQAADILDKNKNLFPEYNLVINQIEIYLKKNQLKEAVKLTDQYLSTVASQIQVYRNIAAIFERNNQFEPAIQVYLRARSYFTDPYQYTYELANDYYQIQNYPYATQEYLKHLEKHNEYLNIIQNQLKSILKEDPSVINSIRDFSNTKKQPIILELYANALVQTRKYPDAIRVFEQLPKEKLLMFADEQYAENNDSIAVEAYQSYLKGTQGQFSSS